VPSAYPRTDAIISQCCRSTTLESPLLISVTYHFQVLLSATIYQNDLAAPPRRPLAAFHRARLRPGRRYALVGHGVPLAPTAAHWRTDPKGVPNYSRRRGLMAAAVVGQFFPLVPNLRLLAPMPQPTEAWNDGLSTVELGLLMKASQPMLFWTSRNTNEWRKCRPPFFPQPTVDGSWTCGSRQTWRRRREDGNWEYRQEDDETEKTYCPQHCIALVPEWNAADSHAIEQRREVHGCSTLR
jgi:hypothetical protein